MSYSHQISLKTFLPFSLALVLGACDTGALPLHSATVVDSAGVQIVTSPQPNATEESAWTVSTRPILSVGTVDGPAAYAFSRIRDVVLQRDRTVVVLDGASQTLRFFGPDGTHIRTTGGKGDGPGEFRIALHMWRMRSDSLWILDSGRRSLDVFSPQGRYVRSAKLPESELGGALFPAVITQDGGILATSYSDGFNPALSQAPYLDSIRLEVGLPSNTSSRIVESFPYHRWALPWGGTVVRVDLPFSIEPARTLLGNYVVHAATQSFELRKIGLSGEAPEIWRWQREARPITGHQIDSLARHERDRFPEGDARATSLQRFLAATSYPEFNPTVRQLLVDDLGFLWVRSDPQTWDVFSPDGVWQQTIELPRSFRLHQVNRSEIIGIQRDQNDVEHVLVFELFRHEG